MDGPEAPYDPISTSRSSGLVRFLAGLLVTVGLVAGVVRFWPDRDASTDRITAELPALPAPGAVAPGTAEPGAVAPEPDWPGPGAGGNGQQGSSSDLFSGGAAGAVDAILEAAGRPAQVLELAIYDRYAFVAYRDPVQVGHIDRRMWRDGRVAEAEANPIDDRVDAGTEPGLFSPGELDLARIPAMVADARTRYEVPVEVSHILIDRFLPFDERVLVRVYARPADGRSGGGYVTYTPDGTFVQRCC